MILDMDFVVPPLYIVPCMFVRAESRLDISSYRRIGFGQLASGVVNCQDASALEKDFLACIIKAHDSTFYS